VGYHTDGKEGPAGGAHVTGPGVDARTQVDGRVRIDVQSRGPLTLHITYHDYDPIDHVVQVN
jgi:hypothetical protein